MAQFQSLDGAFQALADPTRRAVVSRLGTGPASVSELAAPFEMALPSFMKHIRFLEETGWIETRKTGRVRTCALQRKSFDYIDSWITEQRRIWECRTDRLEQFIAMNQEESTE